MSQEIRVGNVDLLRPLRRGIFSYSFILPLAQSPRAPRDLSL
jgi:hypothetical protein